MNQLDIELLERLVFIAAGLVGVIVVALIAYIVIARRQEKALQTRLYRDEDIVIRPEHLVVGQVLSLVRDKPGAPLKVEVSGEKYASLAEIKDPQLKRQVVASAMELIQFTGVLGNNVTGPAPMEKTHTWREDAREGSQAELGRLHPASAEQAAQPQPSPAPAEVEERFLNMLAEMGQTSAGLEKPTLVSSIQHRMTPKLPESDGPRTFVDDIESIVQRRIPLIPALAGRDLHVRPGPGGAVCFVFEGQEYENLDEVPNLTARQVIKDAIQEWDETT